MWPVGLFGRNSLGRFKVTLSGWHALALVANRPGVSGERTGKAAVAGNGLPPLRRGDAWRSASEVARRAGHGGVEALLVRAGGAGMIYELHYVGGPEHGRMAYAIRPYFRMRHPDGAVYQAEMDGEQPVTEWVDDDTRAIALHFAGYEPEAGDAQ